MLINVRFEPSETTTNIENRACASWNECRATIKLTAHLPAIIAIAGGVLMAVAGPWWQRRVLARSANQP